LFKHFCLQKLSGYLRLARPANIVTAFADIGAGVAIAFYTEPFHNSYLLPIALLLLSTLGLYGGGVVMNDVFDAKLDAVERPERPIPGGLIPKQSAAAWGIGLLALGIVAAGLVRWPQFFSASFWLAVAVAGAALLYDAWGKHQDIFGPVNMGVCRGLNLLLGISLMPQMVHQYWYLAFVPIVFIAAITMISRGEVHGGKKSTMYAAAMFYAVVLLTIAGVAYWNKTLLTTIPFLLLFGAMVYPPLLKAIQNPIGPNIGKAVKAGVLSLILMNAAWAAAFAAPVLALGMLLLLPLSLRLAKAFAVT
jgi:hypothetical protein